MDLYGCPAVTLGPCRVSYISAVRSGASVSVSVCHGSRSTPGPSTAIDTACSSSLLAFENAFHAIRLGQCDAALVGGVNLLLKPNTSVQFMKLGMLSPEGTCKSFDSSGTRHVPFVTELDESPFVASAHLRLVQVET